jgi:predicted DCC family thiol-disulfide oxidoreductase YuxK
MKNYIVLFDGVCNLCNSTVQFIIKKDAKGRFKFASLQGKTGQEFIKKFNLPAGDLNSFILVEDDKVFTRSTGALRMLKQLGLPWALLYGFIVVPPFIRDAVYNWVARNRYKWFGKSDTCAIPNSETKDRLLE